MPNELDEKIYRLEKKIKGEEAAPAPSGMGMAGRAGYDLMVALAFFTLIGAALDWQLNTTPWCTLALFFIGFITGLYNAWRALNAKGDRVGLTQIKAPKTPEKPL